MDDWLIYYLGCSPAQDAGTRFLGDRGSQPKPLFATVRRGDNPRYRSLDSFASKFELLKHPQKLSNFFGMMFSPTENFKKKKTWLVSHGSNWVRLNPFIFHQNRRWIPSQDGDSSSAPGFVTLDMKNDQGLGESQPLNLNPGWDFTHPGFQSPPRLSQVGNLYGSFQKSWCFPKSSIKNIGFGTIIFTIHFGGFTTTPMFGNIST